MPRREIAPGRSCFECRRRKIKCDRSHPCSYCIKNRIKCKYPAERSVLDEDQTALDRIASLESRLLAVEGRLAEIDNGPSSASPSILGPDNAGLPTDCEHLTQALIIGPAFTLSTAITPSSVVNPQPPIDLDQFRPSRPTIALLWQKYLEVVDPLLKVFHTPTVQKLVMKAVHARDTLDMASECLLFVIHYAAVVAMRNKNCVKEFGEARSVLLKRFGSLNVDCYLAHWIRYRTACENLLSRLKLLDSSNMVVLQAFTIYLVLTYRCTSLSTLTLSDHREM
jgi:hypothetical protein